VKNEKYHPQIILNSLIYVKQKKKKKTKKERRKVKKFQERNPKSGEEESVYFCFLENGWKIYFCFFVFLEREKGKHEER
jgi:hypothetical protein